MASGSFGRGRGDRTGDGRRVFLMGWAWNQAAATSSGSCVGMGGKISPSSIMALCIVLGVCRHESAYQRVSCGAPW